MEDFAEDDVFYFLWSSLGFRGRHWSVNENRFCVVLIFRFCFENFSPRKRKRSS